MIKDLNCSVKVICHWQSQKHLWRQYLKKWKFLMNYKCFHYHRSDIPSCCNCLKINCECIFPNFMEFLSIWCIWFCFKAFRPHESVHENFDFKVNIIENQLIVYNTNYFLFISASFYLPKINNKYIAHCFAELSCGLGQEMLSKFFCVKIF